MNRQNGIFIEIPDTYYMIGGSDCPTTATTSYFRWKCWKNLGWSLWAFGPPFPSSKFKCSCGDVEECKRQNVGRYPTPIHWGIHFNASGGHKISDEEFIVVRICDVLKFNIKTKEWSKWYKLKDGRIEGQSIILDGKLIVTGGCNIITRNLVKSQKSWISPLENLGLVVILTLEELDLVWHFFTWKEREEFWLSE